MDNELDLATLVDPRQLLIDGKYPYKFLAFSTANVDRNSLPNDPDAKLYIARVQAAGVPVGVWLDTPVKGTGYAFVGPEHIQLLREVLDSFEDKGLYSKNFAPELTERLLK